MKYLIALSITAMFTSSAFAKAPAGYHEESIITDTRSEANSGKCWNATGNWQGGASFKSCAFNSGYTTKTILVKDPEPRDE